MEIESFLSAYLSLLLVLTVTNRNVMENSHSVSDKKVT